MRERACGIVIRNRTILLVRHIHDDLDYWTLPGGGIAANESIHQAAKREVLEETSIAIEPVRTIFVYEDHVSRSHGVLMNTPAENIEPVLGVDPEEGHLPSHQRMLRDVAWHPLDSAHKHLHTDVFESILRAAT